MKNFTLVTPYDLKTNFFDAIGNQWMLITAKNRKTGLYNTMTASWGGTGILWSRPVFCCFIRPQRYTFEFAENTDFLTLSFFGDSCREALGYCGSHSGRDGDKALATGLTPRLDRPDIVYFDQATTVLVGRKLYAGDLDPNCFLDEAVRAHSYPDSDYHRAYICEITDVLLGE